MANARTAASLQPSPTAPPSTQTLPSEAVLDALKMILLGASLNEVLTSVTRLIEAHSEGMLCSIFLLEDDGLHLRYGVAPNVAESYRAATDGLCIGPNVGSCGTAAYLRQTIFVSDIASDPKWANFRDLALQSGLCAAWSSPIMSHDGKVLGTFCMYYREVRHPGPDDIQLIEYASRIAGIAIERAQRTRELAATNEELRKEIAERIRAEEKLRRNEWHLLEAQRLGRSGSWSVDVSSGTVTIASSEMFRAFGSKTGEDCSSLDFWFNRVIHPEDRKRVHDLFERCLVEKTDYEADYRLLLPDGTISYQHSVGRPIVNDAGDLVEFVGTAIDVTEQHQARAALQTAFEQLKAEEAKLRRSEADLHEAQRISRTGSWKLDLLTGRVTASPEVFRRYAVNPEEDTSSPEFWFERIHPEDRQRVRAHFERCLAERADYEDNYRIILPDGTVKYQHSIGHPILNESGELVEFLGTTIEITEQVEARIKLEKAFEEIKHLKDRLHDENLALKEEIDRAFMFEEIVGASPALQTVLSSIVKVAPTDSTVLITGETGTGKELIARAIHKHSQRSGQAFITVNCASIPSSLIASELFGHEKGAFTGAVQRRQGRFELAHSGTIFLDEVGELPAETQIALLRVLQERQFERVGGNRIIPTDVRVIAATNRDLTAAITTGTFRSDLFYRLNVFPIEVPPLRKRKEDIPMLVEYFVKRYAEKAGKQIRKIDKTTLELCQSYPWPGNIRELQNIIERSVILCSGDAFWIEKAWLASVQLPRQELAGPLPGTLRNQEREMIEAALAECNGKVAGPEGAAAKLGIPRSTLDTKIKQLGIKKHRFISK